MARKVLTEGGYSFTASTKTVVINKHIPQERLTLITNVTTGQVIYNFSDPSLKATSYTTSPSGANSTTTIVLNYNTAAMSNTDKLSIVVDEYEEQFSPSEVLLDPVNKLRVSEPQSLIDTDFEYGPQTTKWENLATINNTPFAFENQTTLSGITAITMNTNARVVTVSLPSTTGLAVGTPVFVRDTNLPFANGNFVIESVTLNTSFTYTARSINYTTTTAIWDSSKTIVTAGSVYNTSRIGGNATISVSGSDLRVQVTTTIPHGLMPGNEIAVRGITGTNPPNGNHYVATVISPTIFAYFANPTAGTPSALGGAAEIYTRPQSQVVHRPFDGGVLFGTNSSSNNVSQSRQTRRYFRYQSGKGLQMSSGTILRPYATVDQITSSGTTVTVVTREAHGMQAGISVTISGCTETAYNGTFTVTSCPRFNTFTYTALSTPSASPASGDPLVSVNSWYGAKNRLGIFDQQNGLMWEYDGQALYAVRRSSVLQLGGRISVNTNSKTVTATQNSTGGATTAATGTGTVATITTTSAHNLQIGDQVTVAGITPTGYNGTYTITAIPSTTQFSYNNTTTGAQSVAGTVAVSAVPTSFARQLVPGDWITIRGQAYRVTDIASDVSMTITPAYRGTVNVTNGTATKMVETKISQSAFNLDKLDGTGPSGYNINLSRMQMFYIDYSWYGAGFIRWGVRGPEGDVIYCHKLANNNVNSEAYMRSGNLPGRYETINESPYTQTTATVGSADTTITVRDTSAFPSSGVLIIRNGSTYEGVSYTGKTATSFTGVTRTAAGSAVGGTATTWANGSVSGTVTTATGIQVGQRVHSSTNPNPVAEGTFVTSVVGSTITLNEAVSAANPQLIFAPIGATTPQTFTFSASAPTTVELAYPGFAPQISHWGTSAIMDGRFDDDKSLVFTYGTTTGLSILAGASNAILSIRLAPSADNGQIGGFGAREIINRMQLKLDSLGLTFSGTAQPLLVRCVLNGTPSAATTWTNAVAGAAVQNSSLAQVATHAATTTVTGGEVAGGFFVQGTDRLDLTTVRDLGNSILGGGGSAANTQIYPDGPDTMTIVVTNLGASAATVFARLGWTEAQA